VTAVIAIVRLTELSQDRLTDLLLESEASGGKKGQAARETSQILAAATTYFKQGSSD
jgi:hypothetical protein